MSLLDYDQIIRVYIIAIIVLVSELIGFSMAYYLFKDYIKDLNDTLRALENDK